MTGAQRIHELRDDERRRMEDQRIWSYQAVRSTRPAEESMTQYSSSSPTFRELDLPRNRFCETASRQIPNQHEFPTKLAAAYSITLFTVARSNHETKNPVAATVLLAHAAQVRAQSAAKPTANSDAQPLAVMLEQGIYQEETAGNFDAAAKTYRQIADQAAVSRRSWPKPSAGWWRWR